MITVRKIVELLSRGKLLKRVIRVGEKRIPLFVSPDAQLKYLKPGEKAFDRDLIDIAERYLRSDSNVWDIGANVGVFTFAAASIASEGSVISVEADIWLADILRRTSRFKEYSSSRVCIIPVAVSQKNSIASFVVAARGRASNALEETAYSRSQMGGHREKQFVPTLTMDTLLESFPAPDFIKIDIEGAEYMAIQGASKIISEVRPIFYVEVGSECSQQIFKTFKQEKYATFDSAGNPIAENTGFNVFFVPDEKVESYQSYS